MAYTQAPVQVIKMADGGSPAMETWNGEDPPPDGQGWQRYNQSKGEFVYQRPAPAQQIYRGEDPPPASEGYTRVRTGRDDYIYTRPMEPPVAPPVQAVPTTGEAAAPIAPYVPYTPPIAPSVASPTEVIAPPYVPLTNRAMPAYVPYTPPTRGTARYNNANAYTNVFNPTPTELPIYPPTNAVASPHAPYNNANAYTNLRKPPPMAVPMYSSGGSVAPVPMYSSDGTQINQDSNDSYNNLLSSYYPTEKQIGNRDGGQSAEQRAAREAAYSAPQNYLSIDRYDPTTKTVVKDAMSAAQLAALSPAERAMHMADVRAISPIRSFVSDIFTKVGVLPTLGAAYEGLRYGDLGKPLAPGVPKAPVRDIQPGEITLSPAAVQQQQEQDAQIASFDAERSGAERNSVTPGGGSKDASPATEGDRGYGREGQHASMAHGGIADLHLHNLLAGYYANRPR